MKSGYSAITPEGEALQDRAVAVPEQVACRIRLDKDEALLLYQLLYKVLDGFKE